MKIKFKFLLFAFSIFSCKNQHKNIDSIQKAKWHFYSYACSLDAYLIRNKKIDPLECDIKFNSSKRVSKDTIKFYFSLFYEDSLNTCSFKPYGLIGVVNIRDTLYKPIYHLLKFDESESDSLAFVYMYQQDALLCNRILRSKKNLGAWLEKNYKSICNSNQ
jgi:hypothetical protein